MESSVQWQPIIAILANPDARRVVSKLMLGTSAEAALEGLSPSKRRRVLGALINGGLIDATTHTFQSDVFRRVLDSVAVPKQQGIERFLDGQRIRQYPANLEERGKLLAWVANSILRPGEVLTEQQTNGRLLAYSEDVAVLRRYLVDYQLVERRADGTEYALTGNGPTVVAE